MLWPWKHFCRQLSYFSSRGWGRGEGEGGGRERGGEGREGGGEGREGEKRGGERGREREGRRRRGEGTLESGGSRGRGREEGGVRIGRGKGEREGGEEERGGYIREWRQQREGEGGEWGEKREGRGGERGRGRGGEWRVHKRVEAERCSGAQLLTAYTHTVDVVCTTHHLYSTGVLFLLHIHVGQVDPHCWDIRCGLTGLWEG